MDPSQRNKALVTAVGMLSLALGVSSAAADPTAPSNTTAPAPASSTQQKASDQLKTSVQVKTSSQLKQAAPLAYGASVKSEGANDQGKLVKACGTDDLHATPH